MSARFAAPNFPSFLKECNLPQIFRSRTLLVLLCGCCAVDARLDPPPSKPRIACNLTLCVRLSAPQRHRRRQMRAPAACAIPEVSVSHSRRRFYNITEHDKINTPLACGASSQIQACAPWLSSAATLQ